MMTWASRSTGGGHGRQRQRLLALCCVALAAALLQLQGTTAAFVPPSSATPRGLALRQRLQHPRRASPSSYDNLPDNHEHEGPSTPPLAPASPASVSRRHALSLGGLGGGGAMAALLLLAGSRPAQAVEGLEVQGYVDQLRQGWLVVVVDGSGAGGSGLVALGVDRCRWKRCRVLHFNRSTNQQPCR